MSTDLFKKAIEVFGEREEARLEEYYYKKHKGLFKLVLKFLRANRDECLLYGGVALNELFPANKKIYGKKTLPDLDMYCRDARGFAERLVKFLQKAGNEDAAALPQGIEQVATREALHEGTWKVFANGMAVADISQVSERIFDVLSQNSRIGRSTKLRLCNIEYLRVTLHILLSQPRDYHRWIKTLERYITFYRHYPLPQCTPDFETAADLPPKDIIQKATKFLKKKKYVFFGAHALGKFFSRAPSTYRGGAFFSMLADEDPRKAAQEIVSHVPGTTMGRYYTADGLLVNEHCFVNYNGAPLIGIYKTDACISYVSFKGYRIASIQTMLRMYMFLSLSPDRHHDHGNIACIVDALAGIHYQKMQAQESIIEFKCYGKQAGLVTMRLEQLKRQKKSGGSVDV